MSSSICRNDVKSLIESALSTKSLVVGRAVHGYMIRTISPPFPPFLSNHLINLYSKLDSPNSAQLLLSLIPPPSRSVVTWTALISGSVQNGHFTSALSHFSHMRRHDSVQPNDFTFPCLFKASAFLHSPFTGQQLHSLAIKTSLINDVFVGCSAFDMYSKTGLQGYAHKVFDEMPHRNIATWNACISNSVLDGRTYDAALKLIELLRVGEEPPNSITFCVFLNACSDGLYLKLGRQLHGYVIRFGFGSDVSVLNGLTDFYGKCREVKYSEMAFDEICAPEAALPNTFLSAASMKSEFFWFYNMSLFYLHIDDKTIECGKNLLVLREYRMQVSGDFDMKTFKAKLPPLVPRGKGRYILLSGI
ncbi:hypothetical protein K7X08_034108 [Anisodus acutangulus]|uniref:Pentatricopeptide repeat-containing protein n=1 Tax=Anisodus acutangulus TaxID=402998 RepID=A0A9Q1R9N2_9SOLA|nr:hypothetical protein K7X08_034108 [Anisodus acutangulus]